MPQRDRFAEGHATWPPVALVILSWNRWKHTLECLESLQRLTYPDYQVIVVDNASTDGSIERIMAWAQGTTPVQSNFFAGSGYKPVTVIEYLHGEAERGGDPDREARLSGLPPSQRVVLIRNETNLGFAAGTNVGLRYAAARGYPYLGPLNMDTVMTPTSLSALIATLEQRPDLMAVSPKILLKDDPAGIFFAGGWMHGWTSLAGAGYVGRGARDGEAWRGVRQTDFVSGACFVARRGLVESIGFFDEDFFFAYEEIAYSYAARQRGLRVGVNLDAVIYHAEGSSYDDSDRFRMYHLAKTRLLFVKKYAAGLERVVGGISYGLGGAARLAQWGLEGKGCLISASLRGVADFLRGRYGDWDRRLARQIDPTQRLRPCPRHARTTRR